jgi:hypothetical protein
LVKIVGIVIGLVSIIFACVCTSHKSGNEKQSYKSRLINGEHEIKMEVIERWVSIGPVEQWESFK